jgi:hypothetical protein
MTFILNPNTRERLLEIGIDPGLRHYGLVQWYDERMRSVDGKDHGHGRIRMYSPYLRNSKSGWMPLDVFESGIKSNKYQKRLILNRNDFVGFQVTIGNSGLTAVDVTVEVEKSTDVFVERAVIKSYNLWRDSGYISPLSTTHDETDFFGSQLPKEYLDALESMYVGEEVVSTTKLPTIQKAPVLDDDYE